MTPWQVRIVGCPSEASLYSPVQKPELHIVPDFSGGGGFVKILIGVVLIAVAVFVPGLGTIGGIGVAGLLFSFGTTLVLGGILELITPAPKTNVSTLVPGSQYLGAPQNTVAANTPIPIGFGRFAVSGQFLSFNVEADLTQTGPAAAAYSGIPGVSSFFGFPR